MDITYIGALFSGLISFLSPCVLPLVPPYLCFLGGTTFEQLSGEGDVAQGVNLRVVLAAFAFVLGFTTVFIALGATATLIGQLVAENLELLAKIAGVAIIAVGLHFLGIFKIPLLNLQFSNQSTAAPVGLIGAYLVGIAFAFGWTPCIGPILGSILLYTSSQGDLGQGVVLLFSYSLGLAVPFIVAALAVERFITWFQSYRQYMPLVTRLSGGTLVFLGLLLMSGYFSILATYLQGLTPDFLQDRI